MLKSNKKSSALQKTLSLIDKCPTCNTLYGKSTKKMSISDKNTHLVHVTCHKCQSNFLAVVLEIARGTSTVGMVTDLNFDDLQRLYKIDRISLNEAIEGSKFLNKKDFTKYLTK